MDRTSKTVRSNYFEAAYKQLFKVRRVGSYVVWNDNHKCYSYILLEIR
jgi:hypothetical protein